MAKVIFEFDDEKDSREIKNIITRVFEIETFYNDKTKKMENDIEEYCRIVPGKGRFLSNAV